MPLAGHDANISVPTGGTVISIHVPLAGHDGSYIKLQLPPTISIHVPLAGHDLDSSGGDDVPPPISIHVPLAGHDGGGKPDLAATIIFQSTGPLRGTTSRVDAA